MIKVKCSLRKYPDCEITEKYIGLIPSKHDEDMNLESVWFIGTLAEAKAEFEYRFPGVKVHVCQLGA